MSQLTAIDVLCQCTPDYRPDYTYEWCGRMRTDAYRVENEATAAEHKAAKAIVATRRQRRKLIEALHALDMTAGDAISAYSHVAAHPSAPEDYAAVYPTVSAGQYTSRREFKKSLRDAAEAHHDAREADALANMLDVVTASRAANLRIRIIATLVAMGVGTPDSWRLLFSARPYIDAMRAWEGLAHYPQYPEHHRARQRMIDLGLMAPDTGATS